MSDKVYDYEPILAVSLYVSSTVPLAAPVFHNFQLGSGPCGKVADGLWITLDQHWLTVHQRTDCGELKDFQYPVRLLHGRLNATIRESTS